MSHAKVVPTTSPHGISLALTSTLEERRVMRRSLRSAHIRSGLAFLLVVIASCSRVPPHLELPHLETKQPAFAATLGGYSGTPVVGGNRVDMLLNGEEIFPAKLAAIRSARRSINYAQYVFENGKPAEEIAAALAQRCRAGGQVNVLLDAVGALAMPGELRRPQPGVVSRPFGLWGPSRSIGSTTETIAGSSSSTAWWA